MSFKIFRWSRFEVDPEKRLGRSGWPALDFPKSRTGRPDSGNLKIQDELSWIQTLKKFNFVSIGDGRVNSGGRASSNRNVASRASGDRVNSRGSSSCAAAATPAAALVATAVAAVAAVAAPAARPIGF